MSRLFRYLMLCCALLLTGRAFADDFPPRPATTARVFDFAHVLSPDAVAQLELKLRSFSDSTTNQVTIVTITSLGSYEAADYATQLGNRWGIGKKQRNNGVLILAAIDDHRINISVGKGLEGALPDITAGQIIDQEMRPYFRENKYYQGLDAAVNAIMEATRGEYKADPRSGRLTGGNVLLVIVIVVLVLIFISRNSGGGGRYMSGRGYGGFGGGFLGGSMFGGGWSSGGGGSWGGGSSDSGAFGGGSFGGGGASGSW